MGDREPPEFSYTRIDDKTVNIVVRIDDDYEIQETVEISIRRDGEEAVGTITMVAEQMAEAYWQDVRAEAMYDEYMLQERGL